MVPSEDHIAKFLAFAPEAGEGKAFVFLEGADTIEEALDQFYETPNKYSHSAVSSMSKLVDHRDKKTQSRDHSPPPYAPRAPPMRPRPISTPSAAPQWPRHTNAVIQAGNIRARDEQEMQNWLQRVQLANGVYNSDLEPEHETDLACVCSIHEYRYAKMNRLSVQEMWSKAVMYPGEKAYHGCYRNLIFNNNPYNQVVSPYGLLLSSRWGPQRPQPQYYTLAVQQTIQLNASYNAQAQAAINAKEPTFNIWELDQPRFLESTTSPAPVDNKKRQSIAGPIPDNNTAPAKSSKFASLKSALSIKSPEEKFASKIAKMHAHGRELRIAILAEESERWPDQEWRQIVAAYQEKVGMTRKIADLRTRQPLQYLHLLRAGYFEPIPVAWANLASNPLKFAIDAADGWRGITPAWRGYEDTAEERLYWVLNHREGSVGMRMKPDMISALQMAQARMASAVEPPPVYFSAGDTCHLQHTSEGYSKQVMPPPFRAYDAPQATTDDTMILLDVSGSMEFDPVRPNYNQYLITGYSRSTQPKNKDLARAIIRRFADAMVNHDHNSQGYQLVTFANHSEEIGYINHWNFDAMWDTVRFGGRTRVMTGWQKVKDLHFRKHSESATYHPVYGWQAGPKTPILRLLLLLDGEANDMDEFELELLSLSWVHVTIFLIGVDGCPHHHRHANELQRISEVNHHVSFVDAQGNTPERFVTHELLKRHLGYELSMSEFEELEQPPSYEE